MATLFLKYRPQTFSDLVGQSSVVNTLRNTLKHQKMAHAYLFCGSRGTGKTSTARIFAKGLNCQSLNEGSPCGTCHICENTANGSLVDVIEIDAASNRGIDEIRELRERVLFSPNIAKRKVYIIDEVHMMTKEAFNALLKTLEEPPEHAYFLLATTEFHKIPETIKSRCQTFIFQKFGLEELIDRLEFIAQSENITVERSSLRLIAKKAEGGMRDAISLLEQIAAETDQQISDEAVRTSLGISSSETLELFWKAIMENDTRAGIEIIRNIAISGADFRTFGHDFLGFLQNILHESLQNSGPSDHLLETIEAIQKALIQLKSSPIAELPFEVAVARLTAGEKAQTQEVGKSEDKSSSVPASTPKMPQPSLRETVKKPAAAVPKKSQPSEKTENTISPKKFESRETQDRCGFVFDDPIKKPETADITDDQDAKPASDTSVSDSAIQTETSRSSDEPLSPDIIMKKMKALAEKAGISSFAKKSFLSAVPEMNGEKIVFYSQSMFHHEKLTPSNVKAPLQKAFQEYFQTNMTLEFATRKKNTIQPPTPPKKEEAELASIDDFLNF